MFINCKILSVDEEELDKAEDLGIPPEERWISFGFHPKNLRLYYECIQQDTQVGVVIVLEDYSEYTTDLSIEQLDGMLKKYFHKPSWLLAEN